MITLALGAIAMFNAIGLSIALIEELKGKNNTFETRPIKLFQHNAQYMYTKTMQERKQ